MTELTIKNLTKSYGGKPILDGLDFGIKGNKIAAITGKSGSGKTTFFLCILGFVRPDGGEIFLNGKEINSLPIQQRRFAYVPQDYGLFPHLNVGGNISFSLTLKGMKREDKIGKINELLEAVELSAELASRSIANLSGGEKQRVALARALAMEPKLFLLDEPLSAIDIETKKEVASGLRAIIKKLGIPAIIITHNPDEAAMLADDIWRLEAGKMELIESKNRQ